MKSVYINPQKYDNDDDSQANQAYRGFRPADFNQH
jgi:hypothetical protein